MFAVKLDTNSEKKRQILNPIFFTSSYSNGKWRKWITIITHSLTFWLYTNCGCDSESQHDARQCCGTITRAEKKTDRTNFSFLILLMYPMETFFAFHSTLVNCVYLLRTISCWIVDFSFDFSFFISLCASKDSFFGHFPCASNQIHYMSL